MQNSLRQSNNSLSPTLPVKDQYGRYQVGGPISPGDIKNAMAADPQVQMGGNMLLDVTPVVESVRSVDRLPEQWQAYQEAESPIQQVLRAAEMALEGGALVADVIPHVKALGIGGAALIGLMARRTDEIEGIARFGLAKRQMGIIGGPKAKTADLAALEKAKALKAQGVDADTIYQETRWWLDSPDGVPKFEIDDSAAGFKPLDEWSWGSRTDYERGNRITTDIPNIYRHDEFAEAYPDGIMDFGDSSTRGTVSVGPYKNANGSLGMGNNIEIGRYSADGITDSPHPSTMLHELQHTAQKAEGSNTGGSPEMMRQLKDEGMARLNFLNQEQGKIAREIDNITTGYRQPKAGMEKRAQQLFDEYDAIMSEKLSMNPKIIQADDYDLYRSLAGESEARLVESRMNMTMDERLADPFYKNFDVPLEDQIVRRDGGTALSRNGESVLPTPEDYRGLHTAPVKMGKSSLDDATDIFPDDIYDPSVSWNYYGHGGPDVGIDKQSAAIISQFKGRPNKPVTIYRAVPYEKSASEQLYELEGQMNSFMRRGRIPKDAELPKNEWYDDAWDRRAALQEVVEKGEDAAEKLSINSGDWVTVNKNYAKQHGDAQLGGKYKIIQKKVKAKDLHTDGNSIHEWGYSPSDLD